MGEVIRLLRDVQDVLVGGYGTPISGITCAPQTEQDLDRMPKIANILTGPLYLEYACSAGARECGLTITRLVHMLI